MPDSTHSIIQRVMQARGARWVAVTAAFAAIGCSGGAPQSEPTLAVPAVTDVPRATSSGSAGATAAPVAGGAMPAAMAMATAPAVSTPTASATPSAPSANAAASGASELDSDAGALPPAADAGAAETVPVKCTLNAFVSNSGSDSISVIDTTTHQVLATVPTGKAPVNPTFTPDRQHVYVANSQDNTLTIIDTNTNEVTDTISAGGDRPSGLAFSPDGKTLYVSLISQDYTSPGSFHSIDLATGKSSPSIQMGADPERIALTPDGSHVFANNLLDGTLAVIDTMANKIVSTIMLGDLPFNPVMSPDGTVVS